MQNLTKDFEIQTDKGTDLYRVEIARYRDRFTDECTPGYGNIDVWRKCAAVDGYELYACFLLCGFTAARAVFDEKGPYTAQIQALPPEVREFVLSQCFALMREALTEELKDIRAVQRLLKEGK